MFNHKKMVAAESVGFRFAADLFKSVPIIIRFVSWTTLRRFKLRIWLLQKPLADSKPTPSNQYR